MAIRLKISRNLKDSIENADAIMTLRLQKERMQENLLSSMETYHDEYGLTLEKLKWSRNKVPVLHPGPVNRGLEISGDILEDRSISFIEQQVSNGVPIRMALLYLLGNQ